MQAWWKEQRECGTARQRSTRLENIGIDCFESGKECAQHSKGETPHGKIVIAVGTNE